MGNAFALDNYFRETNTTLFGKEGVNINIKGFVIPILIVSLIVVTGCGSNSDKYGSSIFFSEVSISEQNFVTNLRDFVNAMGDTTPTGTSQLKDSLKAMKQQVDKATTMQESNDKEGKVKSKIVSSMEITVHDAQKYLDAVNNNDEYIKQNTSESITTDMNEFIKVEKDVANLAKDEGQ